MHDISENVLIHYGMPRRSGRYPWGSGENPYQHSGDFLSRIAELKTQGLSETEIAKSLNLSTTEYRAYKAVANNERRSLEVATAKGLREKGYSLNEIAEKMGYANDSSIDAYLDISSVNGGSRYVTNEEGIKRFGWIELVVDFEDVTEPEELLQKAKDYLADEQFDDVVIDVSAVDLRYLSKDTLSINLLDNVRCISRPHGMDRIFPVTELSIQLDNPANSTYQRPNQRRTYSRGD